MGEDFVLILAGPPGVGKTTIAQIICQHNKCSYLSEDELSKKLFPGVYKDTPEQLKQIKKELLIRFERLNDGNCLVADLVNLDEDLVKTLKNLFGKRLIIKVIFPPMETIIERDKKRPCWTSGEEDIKRYYNQYQKLKEIIGKYNYIDNSSQNPEETYEKYFTNLMLNMFEHYEPGEV
jgi:adenylate kinase family enzyme